MKRKIDSESLPLKNWKKEATMFQDDYTAGAGTSWLLNVAKAENKMIWQNTLWNACPPSPRQMSR